jgi:hypothetical protein
VRWFYAIPPTPHKQKQACVRQAGNCRAAPLSRRHPRANRDILFPAHDSRNMSTLGKHLLFAALIFAYVVVVWFCGMQFRLFTSRHSAGLGLDYFLYSAWATCYWRGPFINSAFDPYPFRSTAVFMGVLGMLLSLAAKMLLEL